MLQKAVSGTLHLEVVKTQTDMLSRFIDGVGEIDFAAYCELLISVAKNYNAKNGPMTCSQNRRANTHMFYDSGYDDNIESYNIVMDIHTILINAAWTQACCIPRQCKNQISVIAPFGGKSQLRIAQSFLKCVLMTLSPD